MLVSVPAALILLTLIKQATIAAPAPEFRSPRTSSIYAKVEPDRNDPLWGVGSNVIPQPIRGTTGATIIGPENIEIELQNPDTFAPPTTDEGRLPNLKWPFSLSHTRLSNGGWSREQNVNVMPAATALAGVNMRLEPGAIRELHWHNTAEWAYMLKGDVRISTITPEGNVFVGDVSEGDLWYFPAGHPHSIQAKNTTGSGAEFLLVFDEGTFSEDATFLLTDWLAHVPKEVLAKNFGFRDLTIFDHIPEEELYLFKSSPPPENIESDLVIPNNTPHPYTFQLSKIQPVRMPGGSIKVVDSRTFNVAEKISAVEVVVEVGGMRELHWHPTQPEWSFFISGEARMTIFASEHNAHTFDYVPGDIGYIPPSYGHYVENTGNTTLKYLEIFKSGQCQDISLTQWLALTPRELVKAHLGLPRETIAKLSTTKHQVV